MCEESTPVAPSRLAYFLGEMRRQMNGAVVGGMRLYGAEYGLNYGVNIPTIRAFAKREGGGDHRFAKLLYRQEVRELRIAALWIADPVVASTELEFWRKGIINSEVAEEAAFALLYRCKGVDEWLASDSELLQYCALMSIAHRDTIDLARYQQAIIQLFEGDIHILTSGVVAVLDSALKCDSSKGDIGSFLDALPVTPAANFVREEMAWRIDLI